MTDDNFHKLALSESFERVAKVAEEREAFNEAMDNLIAQDADLIEICPDDLVLRLRYLAEEWFEMCDDIHKPLYEAAERIEALTAENERLRKALRFYADAKNWAYVKSAGCNCIDADGGDTARAALEARGLEIREINT